MAEILNPAQTSWAQNIVWLSVTLTIVYAVWTWVLGHSLPEAWMRKVPGATILMGLSVSGIVGWFALGALLSDPSNGVHRNPWFDDNRHALWLFYAGIFGAGWQYWRAFGERKSMRCQICYPLAWMVGVVTVLGAGVGYLR